ncbi:FAD/NAD(P)-binding domain-containing protein [Desarmillaria tabescens]|uniref:FAD/NAD(P)-binding domain-containing protein n=1 Tax=Armillaria tabescens TaxID=1929756 RepID=A0AA39NAD5_ARMTA|nr:FAD/NAD(P)-binding domain-containing protein [Desarmillaria tabescens]KAK0461975.1 FAD/NAD(P)-binding domain-containing protein [Desarmillaria tabescens]
MQHIDEARPLKVIVVGAGLGGLTAAIALRRQGHRVHILESSNFKSELGAGLAVPPNTVRSLQGLGCNIDNLKPVDNLCFSAMAHDGSPGMMNNMTDYRKAYGDPWVMAHRVDLHNELMRVALDPEGTGPPAQLRLGNQVTSCDVDACTISLVDGTICSADLIVGADGIRSTIRSYVLGKEIDIPPTGIAGYRWLIPAEALDPYPELDWIVKNSPLGARLITAPVRRNDDNEQTGATSDKNDVDKRTIIIYACRNGTMINVLGVHDDPRNQNEIGWNVPVTQEKLLEFFKDYHPRFKRLLELADNIHLWQMRVVPRLETWINKRVCLLGDSAHASLPTLGQGFGMGLEDAVALATLLPLGTRVSDVEKHLVAYESLRKERAEYVAMESFEQQDIATKRGLYLRSPTMRDKIMGYDIKAEAEKVLMEMTSTAR